MKTYYAGMEVDAPCGRCKGETRHRVMTMTGGTPDKLICDTCKSIHKFRLEKPAPAPRAPRTPAARAAASPRSAVPSQSAASAWQSILAEEQGGASAKPYSPATRWEEQTWMDHPAFGLGRVQKRLGKKVEVLFREGVKILISA